MKIKRPEPWPKVDLMNEFLADILPNWSPTLARIKGRTLPKKTMDKQEIINILMFNIGTPRALKNGKRIVLIGDYADCYEKAGRIAEEMLGYKDHKVWEYINKYNLIKVL